MKNPARLLFFAFCCSTSAMMAAPEFEFNVARDKDKVPLDVVEIETGYVFESDLNHGGKVGKQDETQSEFEYAHRIPLAGNWYAHLGLSYHRLDFENTSAPVPVHLQSWAGVIGIDYMRGKDVAALIQFKPGIYTEEHVGLASFDCPITVARFFVLQEDKLYFLLGAHASFLRGSLPVIPLAGFVWTTSEKVRVMAVPPEPRIIYSPNEKLDLWVGGEFVGGSFRTDHHNAIVPAKLSGAEVDYYDYRAGAGLIYWLNEQIGLDLGGGYSIQRSFKFERADLYYRTDPAPYVRFEIKAKF